MSTPCTRYGRWPVSSETCHAEGAPNVGTHLRLRAALALWGTKPYCCNVARSGIHAVCFDLGGVLVQICRSWAEACGRAGVPVREPTWLASEEAIGLRRELIFEYQRGGLPTEEYIQGLTRALRGLYDASEVAQVHDAWLIEEYPGVEVLVAELNAHPRTVTACLSNTNEAHWRRLRPNGGEFPACAKLQQALASHEMGVSKPDPHAYAAAQAHFAVSPGELLFFDDTPENVAAARVAGWHAEEIDYRNDTAGQLRGWLERYGLL